MKISQYTKRELCKEFEVLSQREAHFRKIAELAPVMLWMTDQDGKSLFFNRKWMKFTGFQGTSDPGAIWYEALHPDERKDCLKAFQAAFKAQQPFKMEYQLRRHDGEYRWILDNGEPYYDNAGLFAGFIGSSQDITERKLAEKSLQRSYAELNRHDWENTLLGEMNSCLQVCRTLPETYPVIGLFTRRLFANTSGLICVINDSRSLLESIVEWGDSHESQNVFAIEDCWSLRQGKTHKVPDPGNGLVCWHMQPGADHGYVCLPMSSYGETRGILHLQLPDLQGSEAERAAAIEAIVNTATLFTAQVALALSNIRLKEALQDQSVRDPLTQLYNRRYLIDSLERELARAKRNHTHFAVIVLDIDHFKRFNDTFGHDAGDALLCEFGKLLKQHTRREDIACRYGGEEFVMVLLDANLEDAVQRCEDLRQKTKLLRVELRGQKLGAISISIGLAMFPFHGHKCEELITSADSALYRAKREGRDRTVVAQTQLPDLEPATLGQLANGKS